MHITIIDDERILGEKIKRKLESEGFSASHFFNYDQFILHGDALSQLYIIDLSLGGKTGYEIIRWLRDIALCHSPILIISGYSDSQKIIHGLNIGADDYITKPFIPDEFMARVRALLRRPVTIAQNRYIRYRSICLDVTTQLVSISGMKEMQLTHKENLLLELFLTHQGIIVGREKIISSIWGGHNIFHVSDNTINATISKLRKKIGQDFNPRALYNSGYILE